MANIGSFFTMALTIVLVPLVIGKVPYFRRREVVARRVAKARLPGWVSLLELLFFAALLVALVPLFFWLENYSHRAFHHGRNMVWAIQPSFSFVLVFFLIQALAPVIIALPLGMLLANLLSWLIPPIRNRENGMMAEGVPGYTWHELNFGLIKFSAFVLPICIILVVISLMNL
jgi:hypothetical protein